MAAQAQMHRAAQQKQTRTKQDKEARKQQLQSHGRSSLTRSIARAVVLKDGDLFFLSEPDGSVPIGSDHGLGLYYHDCRFLNGYELRLAGIKPDLLASTAASGFAALIELTNPDLNIKNKRVIHKEQLGIRWERILDGATLRLCDVLTFHNYGFAPVELAIEFTLQSAFEPLFAVRGLIGEELGKIRPPAWRGTLLYLSYTGADGIERSLSANFSPVPQSTKNGTARFQMRLLSEAERQIRVLFHLTEGQNWHSVKHKKALEKDFKKLHSRSQARSNRWLEGQPRVQSDSSLLNSVMERSLRDLCLLRTSIREREFFAAGVPWFVTLFGRDSLIAALQTLAFNAAVAEQTLRLIAEYQGKKIDEWRDEEPGKIMHELRVGEMAHLNEIPQTPYYGTIDATPLFLILIARYAAWTGDLRLFNDLRSHIEAALKWITQYGDQDGDGYLEYRSSSKKGLINQGWKDSGDAIVNADGSLAEPPISLVEVQGYVYLAKTSLADLYERSGEPARAGELRQQAESLRVQFNRDFWVNEQQYYALALQAQKRPVAVISSNPGQALWTGIVDPAKARPIVDRLMSDQMFTGWGIRTLARDERRYNPIGYHLGTVWPHDNALIAAGFRRYGFDVECCRVLTGIVEAAEHFDHHRLPELFAGFARDAFGVPVHYPVACHPQAWAAGAVPFFIEIILGLKPQAFDGRLRICRPVLPECVRHLEIERIRVGNGSASLRFERTAADRVDVRVLNVCGELEVTIEDACD